MKSCQLSSIDLGHMHPGAAGFGFSRPVEGRRDEALHLKVQVCLAHTLSLST